MIIQQETESIRNLWNITGLGAGGPFPGLEEKLSLFGQFVGDWEILENRFFQDDGSEIVQHGELHWGWILDGRAVQDVWMYYDEDTKRMVPAGTTVRFYDPKIDAWHSIWITPLGNDFVAFTARKMKDEIMLEGKEPDGVLLRWIFSDIKQDSFRWRGEESKDSGKNWKLTESMIIHKMKGKTVS